MLNGALKPTSAGREQALRGCSGWKAALTGVLRSAATEEDDGNRLQQDFPVEGQ